MTVSLEELGLMGARQLIQMTVQLPGFSMASGVAPTIESGDKQASPPEIREWL